MLKITHRQFCSVLFFFVKVKLTLLLFLLMEKKMKVALFAVGLLGKLAS